MSQPLDPADRTAGAAEAAAGLRVLVIDDERPALDELSWLLEQDPRVGRVRTCDSATEALRVLQDLDVDAVFLDIQMPGLTGLELAQVLARFRSPPPVVFVTAHEEHAVEAFDLRAVDYVLKPVRGERLAEAVRRVVEGVGRPAESGDEQIPVERGGVTRFINRSDITHVEAQGDYARLHTADGSHLLRSPLSTLEADWGPAGFVRIHRSLLVALAHVSEVRMESGRCTVVVGAGAPGTGPGAAGTELVVSRRHTRELRELLTRRGRG
jgi:DNA-binding LytR/AlgR family response regulator